MGQLKVKISWVDCGIETIGCDYSIKLSKGDKLPHELKQDINRSVDKLLRGSSQELNNFRGGDTTISNQDNRSLAEAIEYLTEQVNLGIKK